MGGNPFKFRGEEQNYYQCEREGIDPTNLKKEGARRSFVPKLNCYRD